MATLTKPSPLELLKPFGLCEEAAEWLHPYKSADKPWQECPNGQWMLWVLQHCCDLSDVDQKVFGHLACDIATLTLPFAANDIPRYTIDITRRFLLGKATQKELEEVASVAKKAWTEASKDWKAAMVAGTFEAATPAALVALVLEAGIAAARAASATWMALAVEAVAWSIAATTSTALAGKAIETVAWKQIADLIRLRFPEPPQIRWDKETE